MAYDTTEAVAKFLSGFQMKITNRERDTVAPDYYVKYSLTLSKAERTSPPPSYLTRGLLGSRLSRRSSPPSQTMPSPCENTPLTSLWTSSTHRG